jgi:hypothetical protein
MVVANVSEVLKMLRMCLSPSPNIGNHHQKAQNSRMSLRNDLQIFFITRSDTLIAL